MPTKAEVSRYQRVQRALVAAAQRDLARFWGQLDLSDLVAAREALEDFWPLVIEAYGSAAAEVAAEWMDDLLGQSILSDITNTEQVNARMRWGMTAAFNGDTVQALSTLGTVLDELVQQHGRDTIDATCAELGVRYARVPQGDTCSWCLILASRGAVYGSKISARFRSDGQKYHGDCNCVPTPIRDDNDLPAGYDPAELDAIYVKARKEADSGAITDIAATMREQQGTR